MVITTSLTVLSVARLTRLTSSRDRSAKATARRPLIVPLKDVRGARSGAAIAVPLEARLTVPPRALALGSSSLAAVSGRPARRSSPRPSRLRSPGAVAGSGASSSCRQLGLQAGQVSQQAHPRHPVHGGVVHLGEERDPAVRQALDDPHLPQRARPVQRDAGEVAAQRGQLALVPGLGQRRAVDVALDVEVVVVDPHRVVDVERDVAQLLTELGHRAHPGLDRVAHRDEGVATRHGLGVDHQHPAHVQQLFGGLQVEERRVESAEVLHPDILIPARTRSSRRRPR